MKHVLLFFTLFFLFQISYSQARIGWTESEIKSDFYYWTFETDYSDAGLKYIFTDDAEYAIISYYFNSDGYCTFCAVLPNNRAGLNYYVQAYNSRYVVISDTKWKAYLESGVLIIELHFDSESPYFIISD